MTDPLPAQCQHSGCWKPTTMVVGMGDEPNLLNQTHDCCLRHAGCGGGNG